MRHHLLTLLFSVPLLPPIALAQEQELPPGLGAALRQATSETSYAATWQVGTPLTGVPSAWQAPNRAQNLRTWFPPSGPRIEPRVLPDWGLELRLERFGRAGALEPVSEAEIVRAGARVEYRRDGWTEWYENRPSGLEQGFVVERRPAGTGPLVLVQHVGGDLAPTLAGDTDVEFRAGDELVVRLSGLLAFDAKGRDLEARFELEDSLLSIVVEDADAVYPVTIDPTVTNESASLSNEGGLPTGYLGSAIDVDGDWAVAGIRNHSVALIFERVAGSWQLHSKLHPSNGEAGDLFGSSVAISAGRIAVGAKGSLGLQEGYVDIFEYDGDWSFEVRLLAPDGTAQNHFGSAVDIAGSTLIVGADGTHNLPGVLLQGAVYLYSDTAVGWLYLQRVDPSDGASFDNYGRELSLSTDGEWAGVVGGGDVYVLHATSVWFQVQKITHAAGTPIFENVALDGELMAISAPAIFSPGKILVYERNGPYLLDFEIPGNFLADAIALSGSRLLAGTKTGTPFVYEARVYEDSGTSWEHVDTLTYSDQVAGDAFATRVALDGDTALIGVLSSDLLATDAGAVVTYERAGGGWLERETLFGPDASRLDEFGGAVALHGDTAIVGCPGDSEPVRGVGSVFVFDRVGPEWLLQTKITSPNAPTAFEHFGQAVDFDGARLVVGAPLLNGVQAGRAYVFERLSATDFALEATLGDGFQLPNDRFGHSLSLDGDRIAVGAPEHVDGTLAVGAVHIFSLQAGIWGLEQFRLDDAFVSHAQLGASIALEGEWLFAGAPFATFASLDSGTVTVFRHNGPNWDIVDHLVADDTSFDDLFGVALDLDGDRLAVGASCKNNGEGAAYVFERSGGSWSQAARLQPGPLEVLGGFGQSIAIDADLVAVGGPWSTGSQSSSGAVWVFRESGGTWSEAAKLTASDGVTGDRLGKAVAISGDRVLAGASRTDHASGLEDVGRAYVFDVPEPSPFTAYCFGDGTDVACPCSNDGSSGAGCGHSSGSGATLVAQGSSSVAMDDLEFHVMDGVAGQPALLYFGDASLGGGIPFGDGLRCVDGQVVRFVVANLDGGGNAVYGPGLAPLAGWSANDTLFFQVWYRDPIGSPCGSGFNLSNAIEVVIAP